jgi:hypothetical protein
VLFEIQKMPTGYQKIGTNCVVYHINEKQELKILAEGPEWFVGNNCVYSNDHLSEIKIHTKENVDEHDTNDFLCFNSKGRLLFVDSIDLFVDDSIFFFLRDNSRRIFVTFKKYVLTIRCYDDTKKDYTKKNLLFVFVIKTNPKWLVNYLYTVELFKSGKIGLIVEIALGNDDRTIYDVYQVFAVIDEKGKLEGQYGIPNFESRNTNEENIKLKKVNALHLRYG